MQTQKLYKILNCRILIGGYKSLNVTTRKFLGLNYNPNTVMDSVNNNINYVGTYGSWFLFKIIAPPSENQKHDLTFAFQLSSGNVLIAQINNVFITK